MKANDGCGGGGGNSGQTHRSLTHNTKTNAQSQATNRNNHTKIDQPSSNGLNCCVYLYFFFYRKQQKDQKRKVRISVEKKKRIEIK